jgi:nitroreductase
MEMEVTEAIKNRRSIRKFKPDSVPEEILNTLLEAIRWAPSWFNTQCCEVVIVKDSNLKSKLEKTLSKDNLALSSMKEAPVIVVLCAKREISGYDKGKPMTEKGDWLMFDAGLAMQTLCLAAHNLGLGTVIIGAFDHQRVAEILQAPKNVDVVAMTPLGYSATEGNRLKRKEISQFISYNKYQK